MPASRSRTRATTTKLIAALAGVADRRAHYYCVLVLVRHADDPEPLIAEGALARQIVDAPRGDGGFGYDPYFVDAATADRRRAAARAKNELSHRGQGDARADRAACGERRTADDVSRRDSAVSR